MGKLHIYKKNGARQTVEIDNNDKDLIENTMPLLLLEEKLNQLEEDTFHLGNSNIYEYLENYQYFKVVRGKTINKAAYAPNIAEQFRENFSTLLNEIKKEINNDHSFSFTKNKGSYRNFSITADSDGIKTAREIIETKLAARQSDADKLRAKYTKNPLNINKRKRRDEEQQDHDQGTSSGPLAISPNEETISAQLPSSPKRICTEINYENSETSTGIATALKMQQYFKDQGIPTGAIVLHSAAAAQLGYEINQKNLNFNEEQMSELCFYQKSCVNVELAIRTYRKRKKELNPHPEIFSKKIHGVARKIPLTDFLEIIDELKDLLENKILSFTPEEWQELLDYENQIKKFLDDKRIKARQTISSYNAYKVIIHNIYPRFFAKTSNPSHAGKIHLAGFLDIIKELRILLKQKVLTSTNEQLKELSSYESICENALHPSPPPLSHVGQRIKFGWMQPMQPSYQTTKEIPTNTSSTIPTISSHPW